MYRILGVVLLLLAMYVMLFFSDMDKGWTRSNLKNILNQQAFFAVLTLGAGVLIVTGGIDLSIGSVVGASAVGFGVLMRNGVSPVPAMAIVLGCGVIIGLIHGLLITRLKLQAFLVTLCGLFVYRGLARSLSPGQNTGLQLIRREHPEFSDELGSLRHLLTGKTIDGVFEFPMQIVVTLLLALVIGLVLHGTVYGRYWYAMGHNDQAARYAGIKTDRQRLWVYILCSLLASFGGVLTLLFYSDANPETTGETWELYAITGAVLGGCSLRGGEGTVVGMVLGAAVLPLLKNLISFVGAMAFVQKYIKDIDKITPALVGLTLLLGTIADEFFRRRAKAKRKG